jgi:zinc/manganese transport system substrate-binding protein
VRPALTASIAALALLASPGCTTLPPIDVIAGDGALCDLTRRLAASDLGVSCLLNPKDDPHQLQLTPQQTSQIRQAKLILINGYGLTPALERLPNAVKVAEMAVPDSPELSSSPGHDHAGDHEQEHGASHGDRDPHVWHDPDQAAAMVGLVSRQLEALSPKAAQQIRRRAAAMQRELSALDRWNRTQFNTIPAPRLLASDHRAFASLARAYQLQELPVIDASSTSEALRPQALASVVATLQQQRVRSLFSEQMPASRSLQRISSLSGVPLAPEPLRADAAGDNLLRTLTDNTCLIVDALGGRCDHSTAARLVERWEAIR